MTLSVSRTGEQRARDYLDRVARKRQRDADRAMRRWQRFADGLFHFALGGFTVFVTIAALVSL